MIKPQITYEDFGVVNFAPRQIGPFLSEVLTLGVDDGTQDDGKWIILTPFKKAPLGSMMK